MSVELTGLEEATRILGARGFRSAISSGVNKTTTKVKTIISREIRKKYYVKSKDIKRAITNTKSSPRNTFAIIQVSGNPLPLKYFNAKPGRGRATGATVRIKKGSGREVKEGTFIVKKFNSHVYKRSTQERFPIKRQFGPSIPAMLGDRTVIQSMISQATQAMPDIFNHELQFRINRAISRSQR